MWSCAHCDVFVFDAALTTMSRTGKEIQNGGLESEVKMLTVSWEISRFLTDCCALRSEQFTDS